MKKLLLLSLLCPFLAFAQTETCEMGISILLEKDEYVVKKGKVFVKNEVLEDIFRNVRAWQLLEFKVFIYVQCPVCGAAHLADHACNRDMCQNRVR